MKLISRPTFLLLFAVFALFFLPGLLGSDVNARVCDNASSCWICADHAWSQAECNEWSGVNDYAVGYHANSSWLCEGNNPQNGGRWYVQHYNSRLSTDYDDSGYFCGEAAPWINKCSHTSQFWQGQWWCNPYDANLTDCPGNPNWYIKDNQCLGDSVDAVCERYGCGPAGTPVNFGTCRWYGNSVCATLQNCTNNSCADTRYLNDQYCSDPAGAMNASCRTQTIDCGAPGYYCGVFETDKIFYNGGCASGACQPAEVYQSTCSDISGSKYCKNCENNSGTTCQVVHDVTDKYCQNPASGSDCRTGSVTTIVDANPSQSSSTNYSCPNTTTIRATTTTTSTAVSGITCSEQWSTPSDSTCSGWGSWSCFDGDTRQRTGSFCQAGVSTCQPQTETQDCAAGQVCAAGSCVGSNYTLNVSKSGTGTGTITATGINCGADCSETYTSGTAVTLTASADSGSTFAGWSGDADCSDGSVLMNANRNCTATFNTSGFALNVSKSGTGTGTVTSSPAGINCGADCAETYTSGTAVTLTASPAAGSVFGGWSGDADCSDGSVLMNANRNCTAAFNFAQCSDGSDNDVNGCSDFPADSGCSSVGDDQETGGSCAINNPPNAPTSLSSTQANYCTSPLRATFNWSYSDPDGNPQGAYEVQIDDDAGFGSLEPASSGKISSGSTSYAPVSPLSSYNRTYYWRARAWDSLDAVSPWSSTQSFATALHQYPLSNFNWTPLNPAVGQTAQFTNTSSCFDGDSTCNGYSWNFGDSTASLLQNPTHDYSLAQSYGITLQVSDGDGFACAKTSSISVGAPLPKWREIPPFSWIMRIITALLNPQLPYQQKLSVKRFVLNQSNENASPVENASLARSGQQKLPDGRIVLDEGRANAAPVRSGGGCGI